MLGVVPGFDLREQRRILRNHKAVAVDAGALFGPNIDKVLGRTRPIAVQKTVLALQLLAPDPYTCHVGLHTRVHADVWQECRAQATSSRLALLNLQVS